MSGTLEHDLFPTDLDQWPDISITRLLGRTHATFRRRRSNVTFIYHQLAGGGWHVAKMQGGKVLAERDVIHLPSHVKDVLQPPRQRRRAA